MAREVNVPVMALSRDSRAAGLVFAPLSGHGSIPGADVAICTFAVRPPPPVGGVSDEPVVFAERNGTDLRFSILQRNARLEDCFEHLEGVRRERC
jgi:hypothetical protein